LEEWQLQYTLTTNEKLTPEPQRRDGERGNSENVSALSAGENTKTLLVMVTYRIHLLVCPSKIFRHENKNMHTLFLFMVCSALFNYVFKALNLCFKEICIIKNELPGNGIWLLSIPQ
jgi:hypothetical protein